MVESVRDKILVVDDEVSGGPERQRKALQEERLRTLGLFAAGIVHELNNPLFAVLGCAELLLGDSSLGSQTRTAVWLLKRSASHCRELVCMLLRQIQGQPPIRTRVELDPTVNQAFKLTGPGLTRKTRLKKRLAAPGICVWAAPTEIHQIILNLLSNAIAAVEGQEGGEVTLETRERGKAVEIVVSDNGPGVPGERLERVFEPFFTTKPAGCGTGLGLSLSRSIAEQIGGRISVSSRGRLGATFTVEVPKDEAAR